ncbi:MAG: hypothetical protein E7149_02400 [Rikenellaceae bacterium]|nr:hypothetical protein [Rikenellaceae bacterium]
MKKMMFAAVVAALFCSCAKDETNVTPANEGKLVYRELTADIAPMGRAHLDEVETEGKIGVWLDKGDLVLFVNEEGTAATVAVDRTENGTVYFAGEMPTGTLKACYPFWAYDTDQRNKWDIAETNSTYGTLHVDRYQFKNIAMDLYSGTNASTGLRAANTESTYTECSVPVAMTGAVADDATHFTFTADTNAAVLEIPIKGDVMLEKIILFYTNDNPDFKWVDNPKSTHELQFIRTQLTDEVQKFYIMVDKGAAKYITVQLQTSTPPASAADIVTHGWKVYADGNGLGATSSNGRGYRYMRRLSTTTTYKVSGITTLPTIELYNATEATDTRWLYRFGTNYDGNDILSNSNGETRKPVISTGPNYVEIQLGCALKDNNASIQYRGDAKFFKDKAGGQVPAICPGKYRYLAMKTDGYLLAKDKMLNGTNEVDKTEKIWDKATGRMKMNLVEAGGTYYNNYDQFAQRINCDDGTQVLVYDLMGKFGSNTYLSTMNPVPTKTWIEFVWADAKMSNTLIDEVAGTYADLSAAPNLSYKIYWIGLFSTDDEISDYANNKGKIVTE